MDIVKEATDLLCKVEDLSVQTALVNLKEKASRINNYSSVEEILEGLRDDEVYSIFMALYLRRDLIDKVDCKKYERNQVLFLEKDLQEIREIMTDKVAKRFSLTNTEIFRKVLDEMFVRQYEKTIHHFIDVKAKVFRFGTLEKRGTELYANGKKLPLSFYDITDKRRLKSTVYVYGLSEDVYNNLRKTYKNYIDIKALSSNEDIANIRERRDWDYFIRVTPQSDKYNLSITHIIKDNDRLNFTGTIQEVVNKIEDKLKDIYRKQKVIARKKLPAPMGMAVKVLDSFRED